MTTHFVSLFIFVQSGYMGCNTGNGKKISSSQAQLGQATCWARQHFLWAIHPIRPVVYFSKIRVSDTFHYKFVWRSRCRQQVLRLTNISNTYKEHILKNVQRRVVPKATKCCPFCDFNVHFVQEVLYYFNNTSLIGRCSVATSVKKYLSVNFEEFLGKSVKVR